LHTAYGDAPICRFNIDKKGRLARRLLPRSALLNAYKRGI